MIAKSFLSYSRHDLDFAQRLQKALADAGEETWVDWSGIPPTAEFALEIQKGIEASDNFVFLISPDSLAVVSYCSKEISHAVEMGKRIFPLYLKDVPRALVPDDLAKLNYIFFRDTDDFDAAFAKLKSALHTDLAWVSTSSRLLVRALEWQQEKRNGSFLLRGEDLQQAESWQAEAASKEGKLTELQAEYILESKKSAVRTQRLVRNSLIGGIVLVLMGAGAAANEAIVARKQLKIATSTSLANSALLLKDKTYGLALLLSVEAERSYDTYEARNTEMTLWQTQPNLVRYDEQKPEKTAQPFTEHLEATSPDGTMEVIGYGRPNLRRITNGHLSEEPLPQLPSSGSSSIVKFSPDNKFLVASGYDKIQMWNLSAAHPTPGWSLSNVSAPGAIPGPLTFEFDPAEPGSVAVVSKSGGLSYIDLDTGTSSLGKDQTRTMAMNRLIANRMRLAPPSDRANTKGGIDQIAFSARGDRFTVSAGTTLWVGDLTAGTMTMPLFVARGAAALDLGSFCGCDPPLTHVEFSADGRWLAATSVTDRYFGVWYVDALELPVKRVQDERQTYLLRQNDTADLMRQINYTDGGFRWLSNTSIAVEGGVWSLDRQRGEQMLPWNDPRSWRSDVNLVAFTPDQRHVVTADLRRVGVWDRTSDGAQPAVSMQQVDWLGAETAAYYTLQGQLISPDGSVVFDPMQPGDASRSVAASYRIRRWDVEKRSEMAPLTGTRLSADDQFVAGSAVSSKGVLAVATAIGIRMWNPMTSNQPILLARAGSYGGFLTFSGDGTLLLAGMEQTTTLEPEVTNQCTITVWHVSMRKKLKEWSFPDSCPSRSAANGDGSLLALKENQGQAIGIWDARRGARVKTIVPTGNNFAFTADSRQLIVRDLNDAVVVWDLEANRILGARMRPYFYPVSGQTKTNPSLGMAISLDSKTVASGYEHGQLRIWDNPLEQDWSKLACGIANRNFSTDEWKLYFGTKKYRKTCPNLP